MANPSEPSAARLRRLGDELAEDGLVLDFDDPVGQLTLREIDYAMRPPVHERKIFSTGTFVEPTTDPSRWESETGLDILRGPIGELSLPELRRFADGLSSWVMRHTSGLDEWVVFDRPAGSERDLVVLADVMGATVVQRHPSGAVRIAGSFGVLRSQRLSWHLEPPATGWAEDLAAEVDDGDPVVLRALLEFAVHDLGSPGIGATLVYRAADEPGPGVERRLPAPPPLEIKRPTGLAPLRHALAQVDGAAVFDRHGVLRQLGARLVPSPEAEATVAGYLGMRHTSGRRYSWDDPLATVIVVSEDGPVTVFRDGEILGRSPD